MKNREKIREALESCIVANDRGMSWLHFDQQKVAEALSLLDADGEEAQCEADNLNRTYHAGRASMEQPVGAFPLIEFRSKISGLWYRDPKAAGTVDAVRHFVPGVELPFLYDIDASEVEQPRLIKGRYDELYKWLCDGGRAFGLKAVVNQGDVDWWPVCMTEPERSHRIIDLVPFAVYGDVVAYQNEDGDEKAAFLAECTRFQLSWISVVKEGE